MGKIRVNTRIYISKFKIWDTSVLYLTLKSVVL
jgi:hypothetical protein